MEKHPLRRRERQISEAECLALLESCEFGVLGTADELGNPYAPPLSYVWLDGRLYFHSAVQGHKISNIRANPRVTFTVVGKTRPVYSKNFTTYYESVVLFGKAREVTDPEEKYAALHGLAAKYLPEHLDKADADIRNSFARTAVYAVEPELVSGKAKRPKSDAGS